MRLGIGELAVGSEETKHEEEKNKDSSNELN